MDPPELHRHLDELHREGLLHSQGEFTLSLERGLEFFRQALTVHPLAYCSKAVQAALAHGAQEVEVSYHGHRLQVAYWGDGPTLAQALLQLVRAPQLSAPCGLLNYLSWALWGAVADGARRVSWTLGGEWPWELVYDGEQGWQASPASSVSSGPCRIVWQAHCSWRWSIAGIKEEVRRGWALQHSVARHFAFAPVPVKIGRCRVNNPDVWTLAEPQIAGLLGANAQGLAERSAGAYTLTADSREGPLLGLFPPFFGDPFEDRRPDRFRRLLGGWSGSPEFEPFRFLHSHNVNGRYCYYYLDGAPALQCAGEAEDGQRLCRLGEAHQIPGLTGPPSLVGAGRVWRRLPLMAARMHALYFQESPDPGSLYFVQDGLLHDPIPTGLPGLTVVLAVSDQPTDANGFRPVSGAHLNLVLEELIERLALWVHEFRRALAGDDVVAQLRRLAEALPELRELGG